MGEGPRGARESPVGRLEGTDERPGGVGLSGGPNGGRDGRGGDGGRRVVRHRRRQGVRGGRDHEAAVGRRVGEALKEVAEGTTVDLGDVGHAVGTGLTEVRRVSRFRLHYT